MISRQGLWLCFLGVLTGQASGLLTGCSSSDSKDPGQSGPEVDSGAAGQGGEEDSGNNQTPQCQSGSENTVAACSDGCDNDSDHYTDCDDKSCCSVMQQCPSNTYCGKNSQPSNAENTVATCSDNKDNDSDGTMDCGDVGCCALRECPQGNGCNPDHCGAGIAEVTVNRPTGGSATTVQQSASDSAVGPFEMELYGLDINWNPKRTAPYTTDCVAVDDYSHDITCRVNVQTQRWKAGDECGAIGGTLQIIMNDGSGVDLSIKFYSSVAKTESQVDFGK